MRKIISIFFAVMVTGFLSACSVTTNPNHEISSAVKPIGGRSQPVLVMAPLKEVQEVAQCVDNSRRFNNHSFGMAAWIDSTNKANFNGGPSATGSFLPGAATTLFATDLIQRIGGKASDFTDVVTETNFRGLLPTNVQGYAQTQMAQNVPDHFVEGKWLTLDISGSGNIDAQVDGIGPVYKNTGATVVAQVNITKGATRQIVATSTLRRTLYSTQAGISFGRYFGNTLATGEIVIGHQQRLQMESAEYLVELGFMDALTKLPGTPRACRVMVQRILGEPVSEAPVTVASN